MKRLFFSFGLLLLLILLMLLHVGSLARFTNELISQLDAAAAHIEAEDWSTADQLVRQVMQDWEGRSFYLHITLRHTDIDAIRSSIREALAYLGSREDRAECLATVARLINQLELLLEAEQLTIKNIL